jgi:hypothetical protein
MTDPDDLVLVTNLELRLAYSPALGRLWRTDRAGNIVHELKTWRENLDEGRLQINPVGVPGLGVRGANRVIFFMMVGRWPGPGMEIDHIDRDVTNNTWKNLRECTPSQNAMNRRVPGTRILGADELLERGVQKRPSGYVVFVSKNYYGTYRSRHEANQVARQMRRELYGEFAPAPVTWRRIIRGTAA